MNENNDMVSRPKSRQSGNIGRYRRKKAMQRKHRRNKRNILIISAFAAVVIVAVLRILLIPGKTELLGVWQYDQYTKYEFSSDGEGCLCVDDVHYEYKYNISGDTIEIDFVEDIVRDCEYAFRIDGKTLTLVGKEGTDGGTYSLEKIKNH